MNGLKHLLVIIVAAAMAGCSTMEVNYDYDPKASFAGLKTYAWLDEPQKPTGDPRIDGNTILRDRIHKAVDTELAARGHRLVDRDPDFLVAYHVSLDRRQSVQTLNSYYGYGPGWGYGYGASYRPGYWAGAPETYAYDGSTISISPQGVSCDPSEGCGEVFGGADCLPGPPPPTDFQFTIEGDTLTFTKTSGGPPADNCPEGAQEVYTMTRM